MWEKELRRHIQEKLQPPSQGDKRRRVSQRALASKAGLSSGALSEMISGKRVISRAAALRLIAVLSLPENLSENLVQKIKQSSAPARQLPSDLAVDVMREWQYFAILSLFELEIPPNTISAIAERLNISEEKAHTSLERLVDVGILERKNEIYSYSGALWKVGDVGGSEVVRDYHRSGLEVARQALDKVAPERRDYTSLTFAGNAKNIERARKEIRRFYGRISKLMVRGELNSVFRLNVQLLPLDQWNQDK